MALQILKNDSICGQYHIVRAQFIRTMIRGHIYIPIIIIWLGDH